MVHIKGCNCDVSVVERTGKFIKEKDAFGLFDLVSWADDDVAFIQVTCNKPHSHKAYEKFSLTHGGAAILQYVKYDGGYWSAWEYSDGQRHLLHDKVKL